MDPSTEPAAATWQLKGAGNANLVFGYHGPDPSLVCAACH